MLTYKATCKRCGREFETLKRGITGARDLFGRICARCATPEEQHQQMLETMRGVQKIYEVKPC